MMNRLRRSYAGYLRSMQISATDLFIFVEGKNSDSFFYSSICASIPGFRARYKIELARELPGATGGKTALLSFFTFLRQRGMLVSSLGGKRTACIFFVDKDVDDLLRRQKRSRHLVYTEHYDVQNYVFQHGNLVIGAAVAASTDPSELLPDLSDAAQWCLRVAKLWREWIALCLTMTEDRIRCEANYGVVSQVQARPCGPTDPARYAGFTRAVARGSGQTVAVFRQRVALSIKKVDMYIARGQHHRIFKGKWFATVLADDIERIRSGRPYDSSGLARRLTCSVAATIDFKEPWADYFRNALLGVAALL